MVYVVVTLGMMLPWTPLVFVFKVHAGLPEARHVSPRLKFVPLQARVIDWPSVIVCVEAQLAGLVQESDTVGAGGGGGGGVESHINVKVSGPPPGGMVSFVTVEGSSVYPEEVAVMVYVVGSVVSAGWLGYPPLVPVHGLLTGHAATEGPSKLHLADTEFPEASWEKTKIVPLATGGGGGGGGESVTADEADIVFGAVGTIVNEELAMVALSHPPSPSAVK
jgi:hypothetical protein